MTTEDKLKVLATKVKAEQAGVTAGRIRYTEALKREIIDFHYESGLTKYNLEVKLNLGKAIVGVWKKKYGRDMTGFVHGNRVRSDVRTKCLAVAEHIDDGLTVEVVRKKYKISAATFYVWKKQLKDTYKEYIKILPDGVVSIKAEKKLIVGQKNIYLIQATLDKQKAELDAMVHTIQTYGFMPKAVKKFVEEELETIQSKAEVVAEAIEIAKDI